MCVKLCNGMGYSCTKVVEKIRIAGYLLNELLFSLFKSLRGDVWWRIGIFPEIAVLQNLLHHILLVAVDNRDNLHVATAFRTDKRINLKDDLDKHSPSCQSLVVTLLRFNGVF